MARDYSAILEYEMPMESRCADVVLLVGVGVMVIELKGKLYPSQADLDQAAAYARDLRNYHRECNGRDVTAVLVPTRMRGYQQMVDGVHVTGPDALAGLIARVAFTSTRTGTSQVFLIGANGGQAMQLTHEASGAFTPTWRTDRRNLLYVSIAQFPRLMLIPSAGGDPSLFASDDRGLRDPACAMNACIAVAGPGDANSDIVSTSSAGGTIRVVLGRAPNDRQPAFLVP
ncbi:MAG: hypothetical protein M3466_11405 [Gemmatimonadota bacterium]|nr:hypothetical protein [Gemmatimonadota bacterium]